MPGLHAVVHPGCTSRRGRSRPLPALYTRHWPPHEILHPGSCWPPGCAAPPHQLRVSGQFSACLTGEQNMGGGGMQGARADGWAAGVGRAGPDGGPGPRQQRPGRGTGPVGHPGTRPGRRRHLNGDDAAGGGRDMVQPSLARTLPGLPVGWEEGAHHHQLGKPAWQSVSWHANPVLLPLTAATTNFSQIHDIQSLLEKASNSISYFSGRSRTESRKQRPTFP